VEAIKLRQIITANVHEAMARMDIASITELSRLANIPQTTLNSYLSPNKEGLPSLRHLLQIAAFFDLEPWELLCPVGEAERAVIKSMEAWMRSRGDREG
jgi:transcriptional regulator with XRE-family HTH domain